MKGRQGGEVGLKSCLINGTAFMSHQTNRSLDVNFFEMTKELFANKEKVKTLIFLSYESEESFETVINLPEYVGRICSHRTKR